MGEWTTLGKWDAYIRDNIFEPAIRFQVLSYAGAFVVGCFFNIYGSNVACDF